MPIYEFHCADCNTIYRFLSRTVNTERVPLCPGCRKATLTRMVSLFATTTGRKGEESPGSEMPDIDEAKLEKAMAMLAGEADRINEDDPRQAARLMRKLTDATGISLGAGMEEMMSRMERGEDPERIEAEMGDVLEQDEPFSIERKGSKAGKKHAPKVDETLYEL